MCMQVGLCNSWFPAHGEGACEIVKMVSLAVYVCVYIYVCVCAWIYASMYLKGYICV
jgi:hypothetical protein